MAVSESMFGNLVRAPNDAVAETHPTWGLGSKGVLPLPPSTHPKAADYAKHVVMRAPLTKPDRATGLTQNAIDRQHDRARKILGLAGRQDALLPTSGFAGKTAREARVSSPLTTVEIREAAAPAGPQARVIIIRAGLGNPEDKHFYTEAALKESVTTKLWEGAQCYIDHPTTVEDKIIPERRVEMLAGYFQDASMTTDLGRPAVVATFVPESGNGVVLDKLRTAVAYAQRFPDKSYVGWSINALGVGGTDDVNGQTVNRVDHLTRVTSVDLVTKAGAGGRLLTFREAYRMGAAAQTPFTEEQTTALGELVGNLELKLKEAVTAAIEASKKTEADGEAHLPSCKCPTKTHGAAVQTCACLQGCQANDGGNGDPEGQADEEDDTMESDKSGGTDSSKSAREAGGRAHRHRLREARGTKTPAAKAHADAADGVDNEDEIDESFAVIEVAVENMTTKQLKEFAKAKAREASEAKREAAVSRTEALTARESARSSVRSLTQLKREAAAETVLREAAVPEAHQARLKRELTRDAETVGEMRAIVRDYKKAYVDPFAIGAGGGVLRESGVPATLKLKCFAGGLK